jgi:hypothetical protein
MNNVFENDADTSDEEEEEVIQMDKQQIKQTIQDWFTYGNEIKELTKVIKEKRNKQKELTEKLKLVMRTNNIDCINTNNGKIYYSSKETKKALSKKEWMSLINNYYKEDTTHADELLSYLENNRQTITKESIKLKN